MLDFNMCGGGWQSGRFVRLRWQVLYLLAIVEAALSRSSTRRPVFCGGGRSDSQGIPGVLKRQFKVTRAMLEHRFIPENDLSPTRPTHMGFRIKIWYTAGCDRIMNSNRGVKDRLTKAMNHTRDYFGRLLGVYKHNKTSVHALGSCDVSSVIKESGSKSINVTGYDYHLIVDAGNSDDCKDDVLAWAIRSCGDAYHSHEEGSRHLIGLIYMCQSRLYAPSMEDVFLVNTIKHEILHSLGVSSDKLYDSRQTRGAKPIVWETAYGKWNQKQIYHTHPIVREAARMHFNCSTLEGAPLETSGGQGTRHSHFDIRVFGPILMVGSISRKTYLSNITIAMLRSLVWDNAGVIQEWYPWVNISMREDAWYGKNAGCEFVERSCKATIDQQAMTEQTPRTPSFPFCSTANLKAFKNVLDKDAVAVMLGTCSPNRESVLVCQVDVDIDVNNETVRTLYYSDKSINRMRGSNMLMEHCPTFTDVTGENKDTYCKNEHSKPSGDENPGGEVFGVDSACFEQWEPFTKINCGTESMLRLLVGQGRKVEERYSGAGCYKYKCSHGRLLVQAEGSDADYGYKVCWSAGSRIHIRRMIDSDTFVHGELICPRCTAFCTHCSPDVHDIQPRDWIQGPCSHSPVTPLSSTVLLILLWINFAHAFV